jgi:hypothetical protein
MEKGNSFFNGDKSCTCGSKDIAHYAHWMNGEIPAGVGGTRACRFCHRWEKVLTIAPAQNIWDMDKWIVTRQGQGTYSGIKARDAVQTWVNPDNEKYPRHKIMGDDRD